MALSIDLLLLEEGKLPLIIVQIVIYFVILKINNAVRVFLQMSQ